MTKHIFTVASLGPESSAKPHAEVLGLGRLDPAEAARWGARLQATARPCGCKSGAFLTMVALVGWPAWVIASGPPTAPLSAAIALGTYAGVVTASAITGKVAGIAAGRARHRRLRRRLSDRLVAVGSPRDA